MTKKRSNHIPEYTILEWLSRRDTFHTSQFAEKFYPERTSSANVRLDRLKQKGLISKPNNEIGVWTSKVEPQTELPIQTIEPPVGRDLPNPISKNKPIEKCVHAVYDNDIFRDAFGAAYLHIKNGGEVEPHNGEQFLAQTILEVEEKLGPNTTAMLFNAFRALHAIKVNGLETE